MYLQTVPKSSRHKIFLLIAIFVVLFIFQSISVSEFRQRFFLTCYPNNNCDKDSILRLEREWQTKNTGPAPDSIGSVARSRQHFIINLTDPGNGKGDNLAFHSKPDVNLDKHPMITVESKDGGLRIAPMSQGRKGKLYEMPDNEAPQKRLPQSVIIGAAKCGTRALINFLSLHPYIVTRRDETHFYDKDANFNKGMDWYRDQMPLSYR